MTDDVTGARKGDYLILGTLGAGGMGKVYKVRNTLSDRVEAMKVLLPDLSEQQDLADRFLREIKVLASLHHPNIAELRTALTINNQLVMIMEYVEGATLAARLQQGPIRYADALVYFDQVLAALSCAHAQRIVHRDIKPANIMLAPYGVVKLMDFGIARSGNDHGLTMTGTTLGSVAYMSPEQVRCEPLDGRSDLYSIGVSLYETITGQRPYVSDNNFEVMQAHLQIPATPPLELKPDIPPALSQLILMAMAKDPAHRFQTADALRAALRSVAPALGEPTPIPAMVTDSALDLTAPPTPRTAAPSTPRAATARPVTARPVTARPVTAQPLASAAPSVPLAATIPLSGAAQQHSPANALAPSPGHSPAHPQPQFAAAATEQANAGNRRGIFVALSALGVVVMLITGGFSARRWLHAHSFDRSTTASPSPPTTAPTVDPGPAAVAPVTPAAQTAPNDDPAAAVLKALPCKTDDWRCWSKLPDGTPGKAGDGCEREAAASRADDANTDCSAARHFSTGRIAAQRGASGSAAAERATTNRSTTEHAAANSVVAAAGQPRGGTVHTENRGNRRATCGVGARRVRRAFQPREQGERTHRGAAAGRTAAARGRCSGAAARAELPATSAECAADCRRAKRAEIYGTSGRGINEDREDYRTLGLFSSDVAIGHCIDGALKCAATNSKHIQHLDPRSFFRKLRRYCLETLMKYRSVATSKSFFFRGVFIVCQ